MSTKRTPTLGCPRAFFLTLSNDSCVSGGIYSSLSLKFEVAGDISFVENTAVLDGGAISLTDPIDVDIISASFASNEAAFGGAVSMTSAIGTTVWFERCRFESNDASNGGALYLINGGTSDAEASNLVQDSVFRRNVAGESPPRDRKVQGRRARGVNRGGLWICCVGHVNS